MVCDMSRHHPDLDRRAAVHAALGDPARLAIVDDLVLSDRGPNELADRHGLPTNLLAHHLDVLEHAGLITRFTSAGDRRRRYVRLVPRPMLVLGRRPNRAATATATVFLCTHNSARSQLAAALWTARTGRPSRSAGTHPSPRVHRGAVAAARRAGLDLGGATPRLVDAADLSSAVQIVTVCDRAHEELQPQDDWWHWSLTDPVDIGTAAAFDAVVADLDARIASLVAVSTTAVPS